MTLDIQLYILPESAPEKFVSLLKRWQDISKQHFPTADDLVFDDLVADHPGLFWVQTTPNDANGFDMTVLRVGPEQRLRNPGLKEGEPYFTSETPNILSEASRIYTQTLETGEPHYWELLSNGYGNPPQQYVRLLLPLYHGDGNITGLLGSTIWRE